MRNLPMLAASPPPGSAENQPEDKSDGGNTGMDEATTGGTGGLALSQNGPSGLP